MQALQPNYILQSGKYIIKKVLGQGGFGITYLAENTMLDGKVAIKEFFFKEYCDRDEATSHVTIGTSSNRELVERFKQKFIKEARTIFSLNHPNIVRILDIFEENGTAYYVMEYIEGESLREIVNSRGALSEETAMIYIRNVAETLSYIHEHSINHLDIKPANIMVEKNDGRTILIDFGTAKGFDINGDATSTTPVCISHGYAPIEQYTGITEFSPQADIYSLGATLYNLLTGIVPQRAGKFQLPLPETISTALRNVVIKSMQVMPERRLQTIADFIAEIDGCVNEETLAFEGIKSFTKEKISAFMNLDDESIESLKREDLRLYLPLLRLSAEKGNPAAQNELGVCYELGIGLDKDLEIAVFWYRRAAEQGYARAQANLGECYIYGRGISYDYVLGIDWLKKAIEQDNSEAKYYMGICYSQGWGVEKDDSLSLFWHRKAAEQNNPAALLEMADRYYFGEGVAKDCLLAESFLLRAADCDDSYYAFEAGKFYTDKEGGLLDYTKAFYWFKKSAELGGTIDSQVIVGVCFYLGVGCNQDFSQAIYWFKKVADCGEECYQRDAYNNLGECYFWGRGVERNLYQAVEWFKLSANLGEDLAQYSLARCYELGYGVKKDLKKADYWHSKYNKGYLESNKKSCFERSPYYLVFDEK